MISSPVRCVLDASVGIKIVIPEIDSAGATDLIDHTNLDPAAAIHVPELFYLECRNILWKLVYRGLLPEADAKPKAAHLERLKLRSTRDTQLLDDALTIALAQQVGVYDAVYVALASQLGLPLVTADDKLVKKFVGTKYAVVLFASVTVPPPPPPPP